MFIICVIVIGTLYLFRGLSKRPVFIRNVLFTFTVTLLVKGLSQRHRGGIEEGAEKRLKSNTFNAENILLT